MTGRAVTKALTIAAVDTRRFARDRMNLFFVFVFPMALILILGLQFGGDPTPRLGVADADGPLAAALLDELTSREDVRLVDVDADDLAGRVRSSDLDAGVSFPDDVDATVAAGGTARLGFVTGNTAVGQQLRGVVDGALAAVLAAPTAARAAVALGADPATAADLAAGLATEEAPIVVRTVTTGERLFPEGIAGFDVAAPGQLVLFLFVTGLTGSHALIQSRQLGVSTRMLSTPTSMVSVIAGTALGRWLIGLIQASYIMAATAVLFDVDWGDPVGAMAVLAAISAVSAGAAMCFGAFFSHPDQASGIGVVAALALAALGGAMLPIELFSDTLATVARLTPHYWALDAFARLIRHDASALDVGPQLAVLVSMAAALVALASWRLRAVLTR